MGRGLDRRMWPPDGSREVDGSRTGPFPGPHWTEVVAEFKSSLELAFASLPFCTKGTKKGYD